MRGMRKRNGLTVLPQHPDHYFEAWRDHWPKRIERDLVMCRYRDAGHYVPGNVYIAPHWLNSGSHKLMWAYWKRHDAERLETTKLSLKAQNCHLHIPKSAEWRDLL